jgi:hypothetical protein
MRARYPARPGMAADPGMRTVTGEQQSKATGIACLSGPGVGMGVAAGFLSSASRGRDGSRTIARTTPSPSSPADTAKARV